MTWPHQLATKRLGGVVSVAICRDRLEPGTRYTVVYSDRAGVWQSPAMDDEGGANTAAMVLAEFLGCARCG